MKKMLLKDLKTKSSSSSIEREKGRKKEERGAEEI